MLTSTLESFHRHTICIRSEISQQSDILCVFRVAVRILASRGQHTACLSVFILDVSSIGILLSVNTIEKLRILQM